MLENHSLREDAMVEVAKRLLKRGMSVDVIAEDTDLTIDTISQLQAEMDEAV